MERSAAATLIWQARGRCCLALRGRGAAVAVDAPVGDVVLRFFFRGLGFFVAGHFELLAQHIHLDVGDAARDRDGAVGDDAVYDHVHHLMLAGFRPDENDERGAAPFAAQGFQADAPALIELKRAAPGSVGRAEGEDGLDVFFAEGGDAVEVRVAILVMEMHGHGESFAVLFVRLGVKADGDFRFLRHAECAGAGDREHGEECANLHGAQLWRENWDLQPGRHRAHIPAHEDAVRSRMPVCCCFRKTTAC